MKVFGFRRGAGRRLSRGGLVAVVAAGVIALTGGGVFAGVSIFSDVPEGCSTNDSLTCADALDTTTNTISGTTVGATNNADDSVDNGSGGTANDGKDSVWFTWTATRAGDTLLLPVAGSTSVGVFTGTGVLTRVPTTTQGSNVLFTAAAGTTYTFRVAAGAADGAFQYTLWQTTPGGPQNDDIGQATSLDEAVTSAANIDTGVQTLGDGTLDAATKQDGEPLGDGTLGSAVSVWYSWTIPNDGATLEVHVSPADTLAAYVNPAEIAPPSGAPSEVSSPTASGNPAPDLISIATPATGSIVLGDASQDGARGVRVYLQVSGAAGDFTLSAQRHGYRAPDLAPPTVSCTPPTGWSQAATVPCTATDVGSAGFAPGDDTLTYHPDGTVSFDLGVSVPDGSVTDDASSDTRSVCDADGNCVTAGPYDGIEIDRAAPTVGCTPVSTAWQTSGTASVTCTADDGSGSGLADGADASFTVSTDTVASGHADEAAAFQSHADVCDAVGNCAPVTLTTAAKLDRAAPTYSCDTSDAPTGWTNQNVTIDCTASDVGSGLADQSLAKFKLTTSVPDATNDAAASTNSVSICDVAGNCVTAAAPGTYQVDRTVPTVTCSTPAPGTWVQGHALSVPCTGSDTGSGLAPADQSFDLTASIPAGTESAGVTVAPHQVCDAAGNCASTPNVTGVGLDDKAPTITCSPTPTSWQSTASVTVPCTASGGQGSPVAPADQAFTLTSDTVDDGDYSAHVAMGSRQVCDAAGNCATTPALAAAKIDRKPPAVTCQIPTATTFVAEVRVTCTATDDGSGLADPANATFTLSTSVGDGHHDPAAEVATRAVLDVAGNSYLAGSTGGSTPFPTFDVDRTQPKPAPPAWTGVPTVVTVLAAAPAADIANGIAVPITMPTATSTVGVAVGCTPDDSGAFPVGATAVHCTARDAADQTTDADFTVNVQAAPQLAPGGTYRVSDAVPVSGGGFSGPVAVEFDGAQVTTLTPASGSVSAAVTAPDGTGPGTHTIVLRGVGVDAQPRLVVVPITLTGTVRPQGGSTPVSSPSSSPSTSPSDSPTEPPVTTPNPKQKVGVRPARDRKAPFTYAVSDTISGVDACQGRVTVTAAVKVTKTVTKKVKGKTKKVKVTTWRTVAQKRLTVSTCTVTARVTLTKSKLPKGKKPVKVRLSTVYADESGAKVTSIRTVTAR